MRKTPLLAPAAALTLILGLIATANPAIARTHRHHSATDPELVTNDLKDGSCGWLFPTNEPITENSFVDSNGVGSAVSLGGVLDQWCVSRLSNGDIKFHHRVNGTASGNVMQEINGTVYLEPNASGDPGQQWAMNANYFRGNWTNANDGNLVYTNSDANGYLLHTSNAGGAWDNWAYSCMEGC